LADLSRVLATDDLKILDAPHKLFHPQRILIMKMLMRHGAVEFRELQNALGISEGNLASHLRTLERDGYISVHKEFAGRRPRTTYELTPVGLKTFQEFIRTIRTVVE
jgi:DNA-binding HxlR family transcriptional regulator